MSIAVIEPELNPFSAPEVKSASANIRLPDAESFRVVDDVLYCRSGADLSDVCWLSGESHGLPGTRLVKSTTQARWIYPCLTIAPILIVGVLASGLSNAAKALIILAVLCVVPFYLFLCGAITQRKFELNVGACSEAVRGRRAEVAVKWFTKLFFCFMVYVAAISMTGLRLKNLHYLDMETGGALMTYNYVEVSLPVFKTLMFWVLGCAVIYFFLRPRKLLPKVERVGDNFFCVKGLTPEFCML